MIAGVFCGLSYLAVFGIELSKIIAVITVLILSSIAPTFAIGAGLVFGLGVAFGNGSVAYIACFAFMGMLASVFRTTNRIYSTLSVIIVEILFGMYFEVFGEYNVFYAISTLIGCLIYIFLPSAWLARLSSCFNLSESSTVKNVYNQNNMLVSRKLLEVSEVFYEMDKVYRQFVKGVLPIEEAKKMLSAELISGCCADCKEHKYCLRANGEQMRECIDEIFNIGFEKGKITLLDIPPFLSTKCTRTNQFVSLVNSLIYQYSQYTKMVGNLDNSKILIADQLCGVSKIMNKISHELDRTITFDKALEDKIIEELVYKNIICKEVAVYEQSNEVTVVSIVIRNSDANKPIIMQTVENVCHQKMVIDDVSPSTSSGLSTIVYKTAPKYNILLGLARANKNNCELSGDSHTLTKITDTKYMLGICDGMGSGEEAERISNLTISLVEDFYKADFDSEIILSSVNKLLALQSVDRFATLDICVLDLSSAVADFIKLGSCEGLIKHSDTVTTIPSGALPIGMLDKVSPKITKSVVDKGDMIVLYSDGIQDAFGEIQSLSDFVNNINTLNPQFLAEQVLARAIELNSGLPKDDMTILVAKVF